MFHGKTNYVYGLFNSKLLVITRMVNPIQFTRFVYLIPWRKKNIIFQLWNHHVSMGISSYEGMLSIMFPLKSIEIVIFRWWNHHFPIKLVIFHSFLYVQWANPLFLWAIFNGSNYEISWVFRFKMIMFIDFPMVFHSFPIKIY